MDPHLKDRLAFMGSLAGGLAHEIKNPLSTMTITLGLLREDFEQQEQDEGSTQHGRRTLRKIQLLEAEVVRLENILVDFLQFAGGHAVRPELVDVNVWLEELLDFFEPSAEKGGVQLDRQLAVGLPDVLVDRELMKQATLNLLNNAVEAMPDGGSLTVRTWSPGDRVHVEVIDTGTGIHPADVPRVFQVYFSTKDTGSGLGLPTVRRILAEHGGDVLVESTLGSGTRFTLVLPRPSAISGSETLRLPGASANDVVNVLARPGENTTDAPDTEDS